MPAPLFIVVLDRLCPLWARDFSIIVTYTLGLRNRSVGYSYFFQSSILVRASNFYHLNIKIMWARADILEMSMTMPCPKMEEKYLGIGSAISIL